jgi:septal ring factor EnvC (AmiA/AmiB activator)
MGLDLESEENYAQRRIERLEIHYQRAQCALAGAQAQYQALRKTVGASEAQLTQSINRVRRAREQLEDILSTIEFLQDQGCHTLAVHR